MEITGSNDVATGIHIAPRSEMQEVHSAYDGSNVLFRLLRLTSWGPALMNLGYFRFRGPFAFLNLGVNLEGAQCKLVMRTLALLEIGRNQRVLDVACGRGKSSFMMHCLHPGASIVGLDLLEHNIQAARLFFGCSPDLEYSVGNAMHLEYHDSSFDRVQCLEAAFHFSDRARFLREAFRVLKPGGRLVVVDFAWTTPADRAQRDHPHTRVIRDLWQWADLYTVDEYPQVAESCGFQSTSSRDWSHRVTRPFQSLFRGVLSLGRRGWGRRLLIRRNPMLRNLSVGDWDQLSGIADAQDHVQSHTRYMAYVFTKPP